MSENRFDAVRELVKDPSLRVTEIAWKTGCNKGHVSRLRKEAMRQELCREEIMIENKNAKTPADGPVAWGCQCGRAYTVTCIASKPLKREWVGLTDEERHNIREWQEIQKELGPVWAPMMLYLYLAIEQALKEKNHG